MSKKRTTDGAEFKVKVVLKILKGDKTLNQIAPEYNGNSWKYYNLKKTIFRGCKNSNVTSKGSKGV